MRLLLVTQDFPPETGGIQSYMGNLARALEPLCETLTVVAPRSPRPEATAFRHLRVVRIGVHSSWLVLPLLHRLPEIVAADRITHVLYAQWFPALAGMRLPKDVVQASIVHGRELLNHPLGAVGLRLSAPVLSRMHAVIPNSRHTASLLSSNIDPRRIHVVHPGVDGSRFHPPSALERQALRERLGLGSEIPVVSCLTRLVPRKGVDTLLEAAALLKKSLPDVQIVVGGSGPDRSRIERMVSLLGLDKTVRLVGRVEDADLRAFLSLGVCTLLSREERKDVEGFGMVLAEAQACGAPVVAARSGGMPEAVGEHAGIIVPPNDPEAAAQAFRSILSLPDRSSFATHGRAFAAGLDWESRARSIHSILAEGRNSQDPRP